jgi:hypothetical protein
VAGANCFDFVLELALLVFTSDFPNSQKELIACCAATDVSRIISSTISTVWSDIIGLLTMEALGPILLAPEARILDGSGEAAE